jgi:lipoate-protein ligase A
MEVMPYDRDDDLIERAIAHRSPQLRIYAVEQTLVVLGRGSRAEDECHLDAIEADGIPLCRRRGGGCSVVLDPGNVVVALGLPLRGFSNSGALIRGLTAWVADGLAELGALVTQRGICDLVQQVRKVGGACLYRPRDAALYSASLLVDPDLSRMSRYLKHPPREPAYRTGRAHEHFVQAIRFSRPRSVAWVAQELAAVLLAEKTPVFPIA